MTTLLHHDETGSSPVVELVIGAPVLALLIWLVVWAGTGGQTPGEVSLAAHDAARLASTIRSPADRADAAQGLVDQRLTGSACTTWSVDTSSTDSVVTVTVRSPGLVPGLPRDLTVTQTAVREEFLTAP